MKADTGRKSRRRISNIKPNQTIKTFYDCIKANKRPSQALHWEIVALGLNPEQLVIAILQGVALSELLIKSEDALDRPRVAIKLQALKRMKSMGQLERNKHPILTQLIQSIN
ncbi:hypothetical protein [Campylobacter hyointestinalis]|uniref:Uncharacterized protein n=1 Tax=Campylobacter hyointestinalis subsp. hyointestinalis TaxID=91352 RepID=A0A0S4SM70_CAMHY|nr:hypothetical protein [Campylobacter hyointestinalis]PPB51690.1 hypothetical protein CDQ69_08800 [Campylobacter hyointestinalis subsp. hyointestinalis]PPB55995.1 hypothetical protein CDQ67_01790 [Campylobacter hyointestinalis subsp. hyointestinalis]PPB61430.1 hypothetical protein CDQ74_08600 [Campylobacter hyointestinalis subsp. hyointestinalis]CUU71354.1 Uncharacterised protein [Campylobacter hyointestinalis subsp. hyointestinalis]CUU87472.1 Uncharacterised protein [Campylobacter hyointesti